MSNTTIHSGSADEGNQAYATPKLVQALRNLALNDYHKESSIDRDVTEAMQLIAVQNARAVELAKIEARIDELTRIEPTTEWTRSGEHRQATIGDRIMELKDQLDGEQ